MARLNTRPSHASTAASSRYPSATPQPGDNSDQENHDPGRRRLDKGKGRARGPPARSSLPTPSSGDSNDARGQKRKRAETNSATHALEEEDEGDTDEAKFNKYFDPNQDVDERREVKRKSRALERDFQGERNVVHVGFGYTDNAQRDATICCATVEMP